MSIKFPQLTELLIPRRTLLLEKFTYSQLVRKSPSVYGTRKSPLPICILSQMTLIHTLPSYFFKTISCIILNHTHKFFLVIAFLNIILWIFRMHFRSFHACCIPSVSTSMKISELPVVQAISYSLHKGHVTSYMREKWWGTTSLWYWTTK
jgi:hypothetical protein